MNAKRHFVLDLRVIVALFIGLISALWTAPAAKAQGVVLVNSADMNLAVKPGDIIQVGYQVSFADAGQSPWSTTISVTGGVVQVSIRCQNGGFQNININLPAQSFDAPANNRNWASPDNSYQAQTTAPSNLCGGKGGFTNGCTFIANSSFACHANSSEGCCHTVCVRFRCQYNRHGGTFSNNSCKAQSQCVSPTSHGQGNEGNGKGNGKGNEGNGKGNEGNGNQGNCCQNRQ